MSILWQVQAVTSTKDRWVGAFSIGIARSWHTQLSKQPQEKDILTQPESLYKSGLRLNLKEGHSNCKKCFF